MHLEFYLRRRGWPIEWVAEAHMFSDTASKVLLVENEAEAELMEALQLIYGSELIIVVYDGSPLEDYLKHFSRVYTSWDPRDRNRI